VDGVTSAFSSQGLLPHGYCYTWNPGLVWLHLLSDSLIAAAYYSIPITILYFVRKRPGLPFHWVFLLFALFIVACGTTHVMEVWTLWTPSYWAAGLVKAATAVVSVGTALLLFPVLPKALALRSPSDLEELNAQLQRMVGELKRMRGVESEIAAIVDSSHDAIVGESLDGSITSWNPAAERLLGWRVGEALGRPMSMLFPPDDAAMAAANLERIGRGETIAPYDTVRISKDGARVDVSATVSPIRDEAGAVVGAAAILRDVGERRRAEEVFRSLLESAPDAMVIVNPDGQIVLVNSQAEKMFGYSRHELLGQPVETLVPQAVRGKHRAYRVEYDANAGFRRMGVGLELNALRSDGTQFPVEISLGPLRTDRGILASAAIRDITERKRTEHVIREQAALLDLAHDAIIVRGADGIVEFWNRGAEETYGWRREEVLGRNLRDLLKTEFPESCEAATEACIRQGQWEGELSHETKAGSRIVVASRWAMRQGSIGKPDAILEINRDVTASKATAEVLRRNAEDLARSNAELEDFAYVASHDLKEPLRGIHNYSSFLLEDYADKLDDEGKRKLETLMRLTGRMQDVIDALLHSSRVGRQGLSMAAVDLNRVVLDVLETLGPVLESERVRVSFAGDLPTVRCDETLVREVFHNLVTNAMKYNDKPEKRIEIGHQRNGASAFFVRDDGIGIPDKHHDAVFRMFKRLHAKDKFGGGAGVGLAMVKKIVKRHCGRVWLESSPGEGTTVHFTLGESTDEVTSNVAG
jgi:PAS domain S-box-containing protein